MRPGAFPKRDLADFARLGIKDAERALMLDRVPDVSIRRRRNTVRVCALRKVVNLTFLCGGRKGCKAGGESDKADEAVHENLRAAAALANTLPDCAAVMTDPTISRSRSRDYRFLAISMPLIAVT
ncbi:hypothetical protein [Aminobacter ciceronei]|uniref:Uncharacterized protein n=1 Tax=Aminobacter ciceronei TaxID=150723 RepID=A0ABR6C147_9HYPH|nr:hypothetical protein [Aminobacter ciceronei]MBA8904998.1 hypothetical protein [Aminobacter ciceronei]MBA9018447.1 hypothetical protein [Aminobacter ciceronei]